MPGKAKDADGKNQAGVKYENNLVQSMARVTGPVLSVEAVPYFVLHTLATPAHGNDTLDGI